MRLYLLVGRLVSLARDRITRRSLERLRKDLVGREGHGNIILSCQRTDGAGAQLLARLQTFALADYLGLRFVNLPISVLDHAKDNKEIEEWNRVLSFDSISSVGFAKILRLEWTDLLKLGKTRLPSKPTVYVLDSVEPILRAVPNVWVSFRPRARSLVRLQNPSGERLPTFCAHLRREPGVIGRSSVRYTSSRKLLDYISTIQTTEGISEKPTIFTYAHDLELAELAVDRALIDYHSSALQVFEAMYRSKHLLIAKSALSYLAGYLSSTAKVYTERFWLPKLPDWKYVDRIKPRL